jgi:metallo-beta-lactamase family protein
MFCGVVYATRATRELTEVMLRDSAKVNGRPDEIRLIESINWSILDDDPGFKWGRVIRLADGLRFSCLRSSHILGACGFSVSWMVENDKVSEKSIFFSGDIGPQSDENPYLPLLKSGQNPYPNTDYIVTEATYGSRTRAPVFQCAETRRKRLAEVILHTVFNKKGKVILPAFSLHRTQELLVDIHWWLSEGWMKSDQAYLMGDLVDGKFENPLRILIDSPLGAKVTEAYQKNLFSLSPNGKYKYLKKCSINSSGENESKIKQFINGLIDNESFYDCGNLIKLFKPSQKTKDKPYCKTDRKVDQKLDFKYERYPIIVASAGMCDAGPVVEYLERFGNDPANTIILTGYQSSGTSGRALMERATSTYSDPLTISKDKAEVIDMSGFYSAHADQGMLLDFLFSLGGYGKNLPAKVILNHGDLISKKELADAIHERASQKIPGEREVRDVCIADARWIDLNSDDYLPDQASEGGYDTGNTKMELAAINTELRDLKNMIQQIALKLEKIIC